MRYWSMTHVIRLEFDAKRSIAAHGGAPPKDASLPEFEVAPHEMSALPGVTDVAAIRVWVSIPGAVNAASLVAQQRKFAAGYTLLIQFRYIDAVSAADVAGV